MKTREGNSVILVKPEYAPLAYFGLRQATIIWFQTRQLEKRKEQETEDMEKTFKALLYWINGEEFQESIDYIDSAIKEAENTKTFLNSLKKHIDAKIIEALNCQDCITDKLNKATGLVRQQRKLLNGNSQQEKLVAN